VNEGQIHAPSTRAIAQGLREFERGCARIDDHNALGTPALIEHGPNDGLKSLWPVLGGHHRRVAQHGVTVSAVIPTAVLAYHALGAAPRGQPLYNTFVSSEAFEAQMAFLAARREVVTLDAIMQPGPGRGRGKVSITFDDAYRSVLTVAVPILERYGFPATVFVPTKWIGLRNGWDPPSTLPLEIMTAEELLELRDRGINVASHGHAHLDLGRVTPAVAEQDVVTSARALTEILGSPPRHFAYPYGRSSKVARSAVARAGFELAFSLDRGEEDPSRLALPRAPIYPHDRRWLYRLKTSDRYRTIRYSPPVTHSYDLLRPLIRGRRFLP
jgi:peptidoglycan/xylan/chitin deacetylase (PgdA/CDA1 family)